jgi:VIT1/CCC1 family predicted Fe2+/Mn2+ transporter
MPANKKYLTTSPWQKAAKIVAGVIGGYIISSLLHMIGALVIPHYKEILVTSIFTLFLIWMMLLIVPYLFENGYKVLICYVIVIAALYMIYSSLSNHNPFLQ